MIEFLVGVFFGVSAVVFVLYLYIVDPWAPPATEPFIDQFRPVQIPEELRAFLKSGEDGQGISKWESCSSISLLLHMLFQEHKDSRSLRRWVHKRLQMEMNDITTRSAAGRLISEIRIRELSLGTKFATVNSIRVESVDMSEDKNSFEKIVFVLDLDYSGGFETAIDVSTIIAKRASLSVKITKLTGLVRVILSRQPYNHWTFSFVSSPVFETEISSQIQGHQLKRLIPIIKESIRRALQRKHVWPNYKIRYRPIFPNPLFQASPPPSSYAHVKLEGGMEVTVLQCSRLSMSLVTDDENKNYEVYCTVAMDHRPLLQNAYGEDSHCVSVLLTFSRHDLAAPIGIAFDKTTPTNSTGARPVKVLTVEDGSLADKSSFKPGDVLVAINNVPIRSERQAAKFLQQTVGDLTVLVERSLDDIDDDELKNNEVIVGDRSADADEQFCVIGELKVHDVEPEGDEGVRMRKKTDTPQRTDKELSVASTTDSLRRHSVSNVESSIRDTNTDSLASSLMSLEAVRSERPVSASVQRTESARVPQLLVSEPSFDLRRTRSESQLDAKTIESVLAHVQSDVEEEMQMIKVNDLGRCAGAVNELEVEKIDDGRDRTLTQKDADKGLVHDSGSVASLSSMVSNRTDTGTGTDEVCDEEEEGLSRKRASSTRRQKLHATFQAGKRRVLDLMPQKKKNGEHPSPGYDMADSIEVGADAGLYEAERQSSSRSPIPALSGKRSPVEAQVVDKKEKKKLKKKLSESPRPRRSKQANDSPTASITMAKSRTTKSVQFRRNVMWGQSLHYELDPTPTRNPLRYLNITVHAKEVRSMTPVPSSPSVTTPPPSTPESVVSTSESPSSPIGIRSSDASMSSLQSTPQQQAEPAKPILLGSISLYIPQLIDDCRLTVSNCHREVFQLKQPVSVQPLDNADATSEFSRHAGFDPRLCYGDITLGFRYFPDGLPFGTALNSGEESEDEVRTAPEVQASRPMSPPNVTPSTSHDWKLWYGKSASTCAMCRGKIWLRNASCCGRCLVVCHNKCVTKADHGGIVCSPHVINQTDANFEDLAMPTTDNEEEVSLVPTTPQGAPPPPSTPDTEQQLSKRTRLKNKMSEKFSNWRKSGKKKDDEAKQDIPDVDAMRRSSLSLSSVSGSLYSHDSAGHQQNSDASDSPMASIQECLADVLPQLDGSPFISSLYFQPGNAYNEQTIRNAKVLGKEIFSDLSTAERVDKINEQIDRIQTAIRETKDDRLNVIKNGGEASSKFQGLDERLQALAVLMLHYCSALQDCQSGRNTPAPPKESEVDVDAESIVDESTICDAVPTQPEPSQLTPPSESSTPR